MRHFLSFWCVLVLIFFGFSFDARAEIVKFPKDFNWCVATAAHQIEGANIYSDHYRWEIESKDRVASISILPNPALREKIKNSAGPFLNEKILCPIVSESNDPDLLRKHTIDFPELGSAEGRYPICEYSGQAVDHWNRLAEDILLLKRLNVKWYRFSVEWAKIQPQKNQIDEVALNHYVEEIRMLINVGIEPHITLFHFTMPQWLRQEGGWESAESPEYFKKFVEIIYQTVAKNNLPVPVWYTFNEPMVHLMAGYVQGVLPPGKKNILLIPKVLKNILMAHALAYRELHQFAAQQKQNIRVGIAYHLRVFDPLISSDADKIQNGITTMMTKVIDYTWNWMFVDAIETGRLVFNLAYLQKYFPYLPHWIFDFSFENKILKGSQDFLGINYYSRDRVKVDLKNFKNPIELKIDQEATKAQKVTDMGWEIYPEGLYRLTKAIADRVQTYGKRQLPVIISENGIADESDSQRVSFLKDHLMYLQRAINEGVDVKGYCYWSLMDNFEWNSGYYPKFGLYSIDYTRDLKRVPRSSADFFSRLAKQNQFER